MSHAPVSAPTSSPPALTFHGVALPGIEHEGQVWIKASDLARALGYGGDDDVARIYRRHADEFRDSMTQVIEISPERQIGVLGVDDINSTQPTEISPEPHFGVLGRRPSPDGRARVFSLRGCHLIAMLARTPAAKEFRRWVLDVLDALEETRSQFIMSYSTWRRMQEHNGDYAAILFASGRIQGRLDRLTPERQADILRVCALRDKEQSCSLIAEKTGLSEASVRYIVRRYHRHIAPCDRRAIEQYGGQS